MISTIIPSFNYGHLISDTIESVLNQSYKEVEVIIVDDGSTDTTEQVVTAFVKKDKRVQYHKYSNAGLGEARNRGLTKVNGEYIQFLDADDLIETQKFAKQLDLFNRYPDVDIVYSSVRYFKNDAFDHSERLLTYWGSNEEWMSKLSGKENEIYALAFNANFSHLSSPLFKKGIVDIIGRFDNEMSAVADYHFLLRAVLAKANFLYDDTPNTYSLVRWHPDNMSRNIIMMQSEERKMRQSLNHLLVNLPMALQSNQNAIKSLGYKIEGSWKRHFLSGGKFDFLKKSLNALGLKKMLTKVFYS